MVDTVEIPLRGGAVVYQVCARCGRTSAARLPGDGAGGPGDASSCVCVRVGVEETPHLLVLNP